MCGILGIASINKIYDPGCMKSGLKKMQHRGPDASGVWISPHQHVALGHNRLAILDLTNHGNQPMQDLSQRFSITFNGEIYNYKALKDELRVKGSEFFSNSDTEVIIEAYKHWGTNCLSKIEGMFAFGLYDAVAEVLFLARDRAGEKPLYYSFDKGELIFSSEIKGILSLSKHLQEIDTASLQSLLFQGYVMGGRSIFQSIHKVPPAHAIQLTLKKGELKQWCYWNIPSFDPNHKLNETELLSNLEEKLLSSVKRQLHADVPVGILLSGGLDSSLITALAAQLTSQVKTFNVSFPDQEKFDEAKHARLIANHFGTDHVEIEASKIVPEILPMLIGQMDEPMIDSSIIPTFLVSKEIAKHGKVALGGDGGDEVFGGYYHYSYLQKLENLAGGFPLQMRKVVSSMSRHLLPTGFRGANWIEALNTDLKTQLPFMYAHFNNKEQKKLLQLNPNELSDIQMYWQNCVPESTSLLSRSMRMDFLNYLPEDLLVKVDRAGMMNSLEIRAPFLDKHVVEFAFQYVPDSLKATERDRKIMLRRMARKLLPESFDFKRKQGFSLPLSSWLKKGVWREYFQDELLGDGQELFDHKFIQQLFRGQDLGMNNSERLYGLLMIHLWMKSNNLSI